MDGMSMQIFASIDACHGRDEEDRNVTTFEDPCDFGWINHELLVDKEDLGTFGIVAEVIFKFDFLFCFLFLLVYDISVFESYFHCLVKTIMLNM